MAQLQFKKIYAAELRRCLGVRAGQ